MSVDLGASADDTLDGGVAFVLRPGIGLATSISLSVPPPSPVLDATSNAEATALDAVARISQSVSFTSPAFPPQDFNGDDFSEIFQSNSQTGATHEWVFQNGQIVSAPSVGVVSPLERQFLGSGDFNGDGTSDMLWYDPTSRLFGEWLFQNGQIVAAPSSGTVAPGIVILGVGDFNGDGISDVLWRNTNTNALGEWLFAKDAVTGMPYIASAPQIGTISSDWQYIGVGDFFGPGTTEILWRENPGGVDNFWLLGGQGEVQTKYGGTLVTGDGQMLIGDFNGDGYSDIIMHYTSGLTEEVLYRASLNYQFVTLPSTSFNLIAVGNYDGHTDVLWQNPADGTLGYWSGGYTVNPTVLGATSADWVTLQG